MLIACKDCHRPYDAGTHPAGMRLRCACGTVLEVPEADGGEVATLHCSSCGAGLPSGSTECGFCGSGVTLGQRGLGDVCPHCLARTVVGAKFCGACGGGIERTAVPHALVNWDCPRCQNPLREVGATNTRSGRLVECGHCAGLWIDEHSFENLVHKRERHAPPPIPGAQRETGSPRLRPETVAYLPCPVCGERMHRKNFANHSGVILDWCKGHGFWFDADELERVMEFVDAGGMQRARIREQDRQAISAARQARIDAQRVAPLPTSLQGRARPRSRGDDLLDGVVTFLGNLFGRNLF